MFLIVIESLLPTVLKANIQFSNIMWFITLYMIGAYISKYYKKRKSSLKLNIIFSIIFYILIFLSILMIEIVNKINMYQLDDLYFIKLNSILVLISSLSIFLSFKNINIKNNKVINKIASTVFGVYIIHENIFMRDIIWKKIFQGAVYEQSKYLILNAIIAVISVFVLSSIVDFIRQKIMIPIQNNLFQIIKKVLLISKK